MAIFILKDIRDSIMLTSCVAFYCTTLCFCTAILEIGGKIGRFDLQHHKKLIIASTVFHIAITVATVKTTMIWLNVKERNALLQIYLFCISTFTIFNFWAVTLRDSRLWESDYNNFLKFRARVGFSHFLLSIAILRISKSLTATDDTFKQHFGFMFFLYLPCSMATIDFLVVWRNGIQRTDVKFKDWFILENESEFERIGGGSENRQPSDCGICLLEYSDGKPRIPRILSCGHTVCEKCIEEMPKNDRSVQCPFCRQTTRVYYAKSLPKNYLALEFVDELNKPKYWL
ncbi:hypothetical protein GCK72_011299 [Caenorhabditis remanei]|uniref:RING-type domain-containing protein n=1 Tax=Caenorhabditis remanei TaxID=31234 RepID=A0A6A5H8A9_CAERE|nr:hypothetical protein GCK72_011299 [Caenorhabditis remanei]KAF1763034.1 hypothetical protein GCK72_011299 [Caenorhabditis remanei]